MCYLLIFVFQLGRRGEDLEVCSRSAFLVYSFESVRLLCGGATGTTLEMTGKRDGELEILPAGLGYMGEEPFFLSCVKSIECVLYVVC